MHHIKHFIWDFDGTLFDSYPIIIATLRAALQEYGHDCDPVEAMRLMLQNIGVAQHYYADKFGIVYEDLIETYYSHHNRLNPQLAAEPMADVEKVLKKICESGRKNYIFTHRKCSTTAQYLEKYGLSQYFTEIVGPEAPNFAYKPSPDSLLYLMDKYGMTAEDAVMSGTVNLLINGGTFAGKIIAVQDNSITVTGEINVTCAKQYESKLQGNFTNKTVK